MILETERLILRPWKESDAKDLFEFAKNPLVGPIAGWPPHTSIENSTEIIKSVLSENETYAVVLKEENKAIGSIGLKISNKSDFGISEDEAELGYWIGVPYWGKGLIPEASQKIIQHGFEDLDLKVIWCGYYDGNLKSKRVQEKLGFIYHHTNKNVYCPLVKETRIGHVSYLTKEQWQSQNQKKKF